MIAFELPKPRFRTATIRRLWTWYWHAQARDDRSKMDRDGSAATGDDASSGGSVPRRQPRRGCGARREFDRRDYRVLERGPSISTRQPPHHGSGGGCGRRSFPCSSLSARRYTRASAATCRDAGVTRSFSPTFVRPRARTRTFPRPKAPHLDLGEELRGSESRSSLASRERWPLDVPPATTGRTPPALDKSASPFLELLARAQVCPTRLHRTLYKARSFVPFSVLPVRTNDVSLVPRLRHANNIETNETKRKFGALFSGRGGQIKRGIEHILGNVNCPNLNMQVRSAGNALQVWKFNCGDVNRK